MVLRKALEQAVDWDYILFNPAARAKPPRYDRPDIEILQQDELIRLMENIEFSPYKIHIILGVQCGMRRGEVLALRWSDVNLDKKTLTIIHSLSETKANGVTEKTTKTKSGRRTIGLMDCTVEALIQHKARQSEHRLQMGELWNDNDLVCPNQFGDYLKPGTLTSAYRYWALKTGINSSYHALRHTHASYLLALNVHPKVVSERLGHSTIAITLDTYSHCLPHLETDAMDKLEIMIGNSTSIVAV